MGSEMCIRDSARITELEQSASERSELIDAAPGEAVELNRLQAQINSLTKERDLGLERVRALSAVARTVEEKDQLIRQLKTGQSHTRSNDRELDALRKRVQKAESDVRHKNVTIEDLSGQLASLIKARSQLSDAAPASSSRPAAARNSISTERPNRSSRNGQADDLTRINGIGPVLAQTLKELGITTYAQIANFSAADIERVSTELDSFPGRIERDRWVEGARELMQTPDKDQGDTKTKDEAST